MPLLNYPRDKIIKFAEKIIRGIAYLADKSFIEETYKIELFAVDDQKIGIVKDLVELHATVFDRKPGLVVKRILVKNDKVGGIYCIEIWGRFKCFVTVTPKDIEKRLTGA